MSEREAQELVAKADKKATSSSWFFGGNKYEEAAELYTKAANIFKMAKRCKQYTVHPPCRIVSLFCVRQTGYGGTKSGPSKRKKLA